MLYKYCPKLKDFIKSRAQNHFDNIKNNLAYDEFILFAKKDEQIFIQNQCLNKYEDITYFDEICNIFNLKTDTKISYTTLNTEERKMKKVKTIQSCEDIYKMYENEQEL